MQHFWLLSLLECYHAAALVLGIFRIGDDRIGAEQASALSLYRLYSIQRPITIQLDFHGQRCLERLHLGVLLLFFNDLVDQGLFIPFHDGLNSFQILLLLFLEDLVPRPIVMFGRHEVLLSRNLHLRNLKFRSPASL